MKRDTRGSVQRPFKLAHQTLCITGINFEKRSLVGYTELTVYPLRADLRRVTINCKQCRIYHVTLNEQWEATFLYNDPSLEICQGDGKQRNLDYFERSYQTAMAAVDPDKATGELTIKLPMETYGLIEDLSPLRICIEFSLEQPKGGLHFVVPDIEGSYTEKAAHMYTYGYENSARLWFPCVDSFSEPCTWKLEFTVDTEMTAVSCGDLIEAVYTPDMKQKTYHYYLALPTAAPNIALAVGPFEILVDPNMHEVTHFCLPHLLPILKHTTYFIHEAFEFYEELMSSRYPYSCYKQVFVDQTATEAATYATMSIFSINLLHSPQVIDQTQHSRRLMATAVAKQFFGCYITQQAWSDSWLTKGIAGYLAALFLKKAFGNNDYRYYVATEMEAVYDYESHVSGIILDPSRVESPMYFSVHQGHAVSPAYMAVLCKKAHLMIRMIEIRIGQEHLLQVLNKLLALAYTASQQKFLSNTWQNMLISTSSFKKIISTVTGKDIHHFLDQWVMQSGCARFFGSFVFNRKRNVVELEIRQETNTKGSLRYVGPLTVTIQELDGSFNHSFKIEENKTKFEITCHSKSRRNKKKKIPLMTGDEVDMDLSAMDADSPVLWLRVDPELNLLRQVCFEQPDYMWQYLLKYERDVAAQSEAIKALEKYANPATRLALTDTQKNEHCFYKIRMDACMCLTKVANEMVSSWTGPPAMMSIFRRIFGSHSCPNVVRQNSFSNFQHYFLLKTIPYAMAHLRTVHNLCPPDVFRFILDLFKYNDNSKNKYSDNYYRAALIDALAATVTPAVSMVTFTGEGISPESLSMDTKLILEELTRCLNLEKLLPCYKHTVTISCVKAIRTLQRFGHLPSNAAIFRSYAMPGIFVDVRLAALEALIDFIKTDVNISELDWLLDLLDKEGDLQVRLKIVQMLSEKPPFTRAEDSLVNQEALVERLWKLLNTGSSHDSLWRCALADLYYKLYGRLRPTCLPIPESVVVLNLKEKRARLNPSMSSDSVLNQDTPKEKPAPPAGFLKHFVIPRIKPADIMDKTKVIVVNPTTIPVNLRSPPPSASSVSPFEAPVDIVVKTEELHHTIDIDQEIKEEAVPETTEEVSLPEEPAPPPSPAESLSPPVASISNVIVTDTHSAAVLVKEEPSAEQSVLPVELISFKEETIDMETDNVSEVKVIPEQSPSPILPVSPIGDSSSPLSRKRKAESPLPDLEPEFESVVVMETETVKLDNIVEHKPESPIESERLLLRSALMENVPVKSSFTTDTVTQNTSFITDPIPHTSLLPETLPPWSSSSLPEMPPMTTSYSTVVHSVVSVHDGDGHNKKGPVKLRIKIGGKSSEEEEAVPLTPSVPPSTGGSGTFASEFCRFIAVKQEKVPNEGKPPHAERSMSKFSRSDNMSWLSEDSLSPHESPLHMTSSVPVLSVTDSQEKDRLTTSHSLPLVLSSAEPERAERSIPPLHLTITHDRSDRGDYRSSTHDKLDDGARSYHHKKKKKKEKHRHKHKHKHKHERHDKGERSSSKSEHRSSEMSSHKGERTDKYSDSHHSSGASNLSPAVVVRSRPPSSPEFEVM